MQVGAVAGPVVGKVVDVTLAAVIVFNRTVRAAPVSVEVLPVVTLLTNLNYVVSTAKSYNLFRYLWFAYPINQ